jgi:cellulose synthase/poly-beta-1,6-N-acetylglucosamine synthase-like glycosyltransferase
MVTISYAITACNEHVELERLLDQLNEHIRPEDEIVIQLDTTATDEVVKVAEKYNVGTKYEYHRVYASLNGDFASFKNNLNKHCTRDWIVYLDADEYISNELIYYLPEILKLNPDIEVYGVPRINTVENIGLSHVQKWGWNISKNKNFITEKEIDLNNSKDLDHYNLLKKYNLIIEEHMFS